MFFIPIGTDAPIYHWPYATVGMIVLTVLAYFVQVNVLVDDRPAVVLQKALEESEDVEQEADSPRESSGWRSLQTWMLATGDGIRPMQWLTHLFLHGDPLHLVGNMLFLWCFGLIVEGKVGPWWFLGLYLGSGVAEGAVIQTSLLWTEPNNLLGASGAVFALLGIALIWAPANEFQVFYLIFLGFRIFTGIKEIAVAWFAALYFGMNVVGFVMSLLMHEGELALSSEFAHLAGGLMGLGAGVGMLKANLVDCEGWDAFARWKKRSEKTRAILTGGEPRRRRPAQAKGKQKARGGRTAGLTDPQRVEDARRRIGAMLDQGMPMAALAVYKKSAETLPGWGLTESEHVRLIKELHAEKAWSESVPVLRDFIRAFPQKAVKPRLRLAQVLIGQLERPAAGLKVLREMEGQALPPDLESVRRQLEGQAERMLEEGVLELEEEI